MIQDYERIEKAIVYLQNNFKSQPNLQELANHVHVSPFHFQRLFQQWAGISPKKFLSFLNIEYSKTLLRKNSSLVDTSLELGLSSTSRLHDLFISVEGMSPAEYKHGGKGLVIQYSFEESIFGKIIVGSTDKGVCHLQFFMEKNAALAHLMRRFPNAKFIESKQEIHSKALQFFSSATNMSDTLHLHLKGSDFQIKVWQALLNIPLGQVSSYSTIAESLQNPKACRAVGSAIGANTIAILIPCHRVIKSTGVTGEYRWGCHRKMAILAWEAAKVFEGELLDDSTLIL